MRTLTAVLVLVLALALAGCNVAMLTDGGQAAGDGGPTNEEDGGMGDAGAWSEDPALCDPVCAKLTAGGCVNPSGTCASDCRASMAKIPAACVDEMHELMVCASNAEVDCQSSGLTPFVGCDPRQAAFDACAMPTGNDGGVIEEDGGGGSYPDDDTICKTLCDKYATQECRGQYEDEQTCFEFCTMDFQKQMDCAYQKRTLLWCVADTAHLCDPGAPAYAPQCDEAQAAFDSCLDYPDGGPIGADAGYPSDKLCTGKHQWDPCVAPDYEGFCLNLGGLRQCVRACTQPGDPCPDGTCYIAGLSDWAACLPTGTRAAGENCTEPNDCTSGMICIGYNGPPDLCRPLCSDAKPCAAGECIEFDKEIRYCY